MFAARPLFSRKRKWIGGLAKSAPTSLLADQQKKRSDANQHRNQNTDDERNHPLPTGLNFFRSSALAPLRVPTRTEACPWRSAPSSALLCSGLIMLATTVNLPARVAPSPQTLIRADVGIHHIGAPEEFGFGCARHQTGHGHNGFLQLFLQRVEKESRKALVPL